MKIYLLILLTFSLADDISLPDENIIDLGKKRYQTTAFVEIYDNVTPAESRENATNRALKNIIEFYSGVEISSTSLSIIAETDLQMDIDHFSELINTMSIGIILKKEILDHGINRIGDRLIYEVTLKAKVGKLKGERDPLFKIKADLNRDYYHDDDDMIINVKSTKDCYIYIFNILSDETVTTLMPNQYSNDNFLSRNDSLIIPSKGGVINRLRIDIPEGTKQATELIMILAIKANKDSMKKDFNLIMGDYNMALNELMEFIIDFPMNQVAQLNLPYVIKERE